MQYQDLFTNIANLVRYIPTAWPEVDAYAYGVKALDVALNDPEEARQSKQVLIDLVTGLATVGYADEALTWRSVLWAAQDGPQELLKYLKVL